MRADAVYAGTHVSTVCLPKKDNFSSQCDEKCTLRVITVVMSATRSSVSDDSPSEGLVWTEDNSYKTGGVKSFFTSTRVVSALRGTPNPLLARELLGKMIMYSESYDYNLGEKKAVEKAIFRFETTFGKVSSDSVNLYVDVMKTGAFVPHEMTKKEAESYLDLDKQYIIFSPKWSRSTLCLCYRRDRTSAGPAEGGEVKDTAYPFYEFRFEKDGSIDCSPGVQYYRAKENGESTVTYDRLSDLLNELRFRGKIPISEGDVNEILRIYDE